MSTITRTLRNLRRIGVKDYFHQMMWLTNSRALTGDTKAGTLIGTDRYGNKYYENMTEELPLRTRWVDYKEHEYMPCQIEPGCTTDTKANTGTPGSPTWLILPDHRQDYAGRSPHLGAPRAPSQPDSQPCCFQDLLYVTPAPSIMLGSPLLLSGKSIDLVG
ncbi:NADH-ubiquinone oxidoreductase subunit B17.2 [Penicillium hetheringtonii]|uniref:NADH dehydrogenase [ubiquinone] 1 alpha subcomplex subunit n=1 Tax=Penicillium hetheringtonii TaxID=911720 RepID=A0AAD6GRL1_9EURO|nr:NADH-ubiquinone oxidoreductase subunit B17.2 [Penicillium hetheringtonii]